MPPRRTTISPAFFSCRSRAFFGLETLNCVILKKVALKAKRREGIFMAMSVSEIKAAMARGEIQAYYQPQYDASL